MKTELLPLVSVRQARHTWVSIPERNASWSIQEEAFPATGSASAKLLFLLRYAVLAPSPYNTQPWKFDVGTDSIDLIADRSRALPVLDPHDRGLVISCGAVLENLLVAARYFEYSGSIEMFPDRAAPDWIARLTCRAGAMPDVIDRDLFRSIPMARSMDGPFDLASPSKHLLCGLRAQAARHGCTLRFTERSGVREQLEDMIIDADHWQGLQEKLVSERSAWTREPGENALDGMVPEKLCCSRRMQDLGAPEWSTDVFPMSAKEQHDLQLAALVQSAPVLAVLGTRYDTPRDWLRAGQVCQQLTLSARHAGVWLSPFNQPIEVPSVRRRLRGMLRSHKWPQMVVRLGFGPEVKPTPRRSPQIVDSPH